MNEREKLIELLLKCDKNNEVLDCFNERPKKIQCAEIIADYLLASGMIVPPCKVGDAVYSYFHRWIEEDGIFPYQITNITITQNKKGEWTKKYRAMRLIEGKTIDWQLNFSFDDLGKTVFLTREDAEKALKGETR